ncbi:MAG: peroxiredoxin [Methanomicrobiales archaeon]|nr:peroxiredoxin [Methanomicrobiales archaeon]
MVTSQSDPLIGKIAPSFCLPDATGTNNCLESFRGKWVVLYFYPRDNTPGCTIEAVHFNEARERFVDLGAMVIGVSADSPESHQKFAEKHHLSILLLSDTGHAVIDAYGSWKPKTMFGKEFFGTQRDTFLIDPKGTIVAVWRKVSPMTHAEDVEAMLRAELNRAGK